MQSSWRTLPLFSFWHHFEFKHATGMQDKHFLSKGDIVRLLPLLASLGNTTNPLCQKSVLSTTWFSLSSTCFETPQLCHANHWAAGLLSLLPGQGPWSCRSPEPGSPWKGTHGCSCTEGQEPIVQGSELRAMTTSLNHPSFISVLQAALLWHWAGSCPKTGWVFQSAPCAPYSHRSVLTAGAVVKPRSSYTAWPGAFASPFSLSHPSCLFQGLCIIYQDQLPALMSEIRRREEQPSCLPPKVQSWIWTIHLAFNCTGFDLAFVIYLSWWTIDC